MKKENFSIEEAMAQFLDPDAIRVAPYKLYRLQSKATRLYYTLDKEGEPRFYPSTTTVLKGLLPTSPYLIKWIASKGIEAAETYRDERAHYGSIMHGLFAVIMMKGKIDLENEVSEFIYDYLTRHELEQTFQNKWCRELQKDILSFAQFTYDYKIKPLAIEVPLKSDELGVGGCLDMPCRMEIAVKKREGDVIKSGPNKGERKVIAVPETITALVDFKSNRDSFWVENEYQLLFYEAIWNETFPDLKLDRLYNFSPKEWRDNPTYNLKDQTDTKARIKLPHYCNLIRDENVTAGRRVKIFRGNVKMNESPDVNIERYSYEEIAKKKLDVEPTLPPIKRNKK